LVAGGGVVNFIPTIITIRFDEFLHNRAHIGGAIASREGPLLIIKSTFFGNEGDYGGAIYSEGALTVAHSRITGNTAATYGAGIYVVGGVSPNLVHTSVTGNAPIDIFVEPE